MAGIKQMNRKEANPRARFRDYGDQAAHCMSSMQRSTPSENLPRSSLAQLSGRSFACGFAHVHRRRDIAATNPTHYAELRIVFNRNLSGYFFSGLEP